MSRSTARPSNRARRMLWSIVRIAVVAYVCILLLMCACQSRFVYFPMREIARTPEAAGMAYEAVEFEAADGVKLSAWFVPAEKPRGVVLFCHGNAGNISHRIETLQLYHGLGMSTLLFDYRGYGQSEGKPSEKGTYRDAEAAWRYLTETRGVAADRIVIHGRSLGGSIAAWLAREHTPAALIIESTFTSVPDLGAKLYPFLPVRLIARIHYRTKDHLPEVACPVLVIHSPADEIVPYAHGRALFEAASEPKTFLELTGDHNDGWMLAGARYTGALDAFIAAHVRREGVQ